MVMGKCCRPKCRSCQGKFTTSCPRRELYNLLEEEPFRRNPLNFHQKIKTFVLASMLEVKFDNRASTRRFRDPPQHVLGQSVGQARLASASRATKHDAAVIEHQLRISLHRLKSNARSSTESSLPSKCATSWFFNTRQLFLP
ncbi:unnamed protein product [Clavelina lepadiformis]|uniref:Uncharacterized protein n=1 Tax=Clavelina lepadiformis TaxID=159417 RepID=A0ABP0GJG3_CLALP